MLTSRLSLFFNDTATTDISALALPDALPISSGVSSGLPAGGTSDRYPCRSRSAAATRSGHGASGRTSTSRSEEHTSELQSRQYLVCRLLLQKKSSRTSGTDARCSPDTPSDAS